MPFGLASFIAASLRLSAKSLQCERPGGGGCVGPSAAHRPRTRSPDNITLSDADEHIEPLGTSSTTRRHHSDSFPARILAAAAERASAGAAEPPLCHRDLSTNNNQAFRSFMTIAGLTRTYHYTST